MIKKKDRLFTCEECGMKYKKEKIAKECEKYCGENHACNLDLIKHAISDKN